MRIVKAFALVLALYLTADFLDASAPGVFFFDSALFLGAVVPSKDRAADPADHAHDACSLSKDGLPDVTAERRPIRRACLTVPIVPIGTPLARSATAAADPPAPSSDH